MKTLTLHLAFILLLIFSSPLLAADTGKIGIFIKPGSDRLKEEKKQRTVMTNLYRNGELVAQKETDLDDYLSFNKLPVGGIYSLTFEGGGLQTIEKNGIEVFKNKTTELKTVLFEGSGMISYYFNNSKLPTHLNKDDVQNRIKQLENELKFLRQF